jgi:hypothetical protein
MSVGGKNFLEKAAVPITYVSGQKVFDFASNYTDVKSAYVTVNGVKRTDYTLAGSLKSGTSGRVKLTFANNLNVGDLLQVWFFASEDKGFSEVKEQVISATTGTTTFALDYVPGNIEPYHGQIIVERNGTRLAPPDTVYYSAANGVRSFSLDQHNEKGMVDKSRLEVYVDGVRRKFGKNIKLDRLNGVVEFAASELTDDNVVAITILREHDYYVSNNQLVLTETVDVSLPSTIKVTTFNNHDSSLFRRERFKGNYSGVFKLSRTVLSSSYVWVEINGKPITRETEFRIKSDNRTVVLNETYRLTPSDIVVIMSAVDRTSEGLIGYRMFQDNLGRTHYKRISQQNSTQLAADLLPTDTSITVEDASVLAVPNHEKNRPGVILIDGERIEFYKVEGNKLSWLRRGTLGTGIKSLHKESSIVLDQSPTQNIPLTDTKNVDKFKVSTTTDVNFTLTNVVIDNTADNVFNHIEVVYQGRVLRKPISNPASMYKITDVSVAYDSGEVNSAGTSSTVILNPEFSINTVTNLVTINFQPQVGAEVKVVQSLSQEVGFEYSNLHSRNVEQVKFLLERPSFLPDKYYYGQNTTTDQYLVLESGDTLDSETGDPLIGS